MNGENIVDLKDVKLKEHATKATNANLLVEQLGNHNQFKVGDGLYVNVAFVETDKTLTEALQEMFERM